jgi:two-component system response regulator DesR
MLCESQRVIAEAMSATLSKADGLECVGVARSYWMARRQLETTAVEVVIVSLDFHEEELRALIGHARGTRVVLLANQVTAQLMAVEQECPSLTVVSIDAPLVDVIHHLRGEAHRELNTTPVSRGRLSNREFETLKLLNQGMAAAEMAEHLGLSIHTIRFHIKALLAKLGVSSQSGAVLAGIELGYISPPPRRSHRSIEITAGEDRSLVAVP